MKQQFFIPFFFGKIAIFSISCQYFAPLFAQNDIYQTSNVAYVDFVIAVYVAGTFIAVRRVFAQNVIHKCRHIGYIHFPVAVDIAFAGRRGGKFLELGVEIDKALVQVGLDGLNGCGIIAREFPSCSAICC